MIFVADIKREVAAYYGISVENIDSRDRTAKYTFPRHMAICLAARLTRHGTARLGQFFHRDHSTIIHARDDIETRAALIGPTRAALNAIERKLGVYEPTDEEIREDAIQGSANLRDAIAMVLER